MGSLCETQQVRAPAPDLAEFMFNNCNYKALLTPSRPFWRKTPSSCMFGNALVFEDVVRWVPALMKSHVGGLSPVSFLDLC